MMCQALKLDTEDIKGDEMISGLLIFRKNYQPIYSMSSHLNEWGKRLMSAM